MQLAADVRPDEGEPGQEHEVDEADERGLGQGESAHLLLDRAVAGPQLEPHPLVGGRGHGPLHLEPLVAPAVRVLVEHLAAGFGHPDHPRALGVDEVLLEELAHQPAVRVVGGEAEPHDPQVLAPGGGERDRVLLLARARGAPAPSSASLRARNSALPDSARPAAPRGFDQASRRSDSNSTSPSPASARAARTIAGPALEQPLRPHRPGRLERLPARRLLEVLLRVVEQLGRLAQQAQLEVLGVLGDRVEGQHAEGHGGQEHGPDEDRHDAAARVGDRGEALLDVRHGQGRLYHRRGAHAAGAARASRLNDVTG